MKNFHCAKCGNAVFFENDECLNCGSAIGFDSVALRVVAIEPSDTSDARLYRRIGPGQTELFRYCANTRYSVCNWLTPHDSANGFCTACNLNRLIPDLSDPKGLPAWRDLERAKKRLVYSLLRFRLPFGKRASRKGPLNFNFIADASTGHLDGVVTIDVLETDAVERERQRQMFDEPYRSLLGHLRHESGHYYWMVLVEEAGRCHEFRALFGDEREDYGTALARHHGGGAPSGWQKQFVSAYASAHPWEDWAETWAHYLHMVDAVDTAQAEGLRAGDGSQTGVAAMPLKLEDPYVAASCETLMERWIPLSIALNSLSRSMGHDDFYPFVIPGDAIAKLAFVHRMIHQHVFAEQL